MLFPAVPLLIYNPVAWNWSTGLDQLKAVHQKSDVSRLRHSETIALTKEDPTVNELPIEDFNLQHRSVP